MRETDHLPIDPLGQLGKAIKPVAPPPPDPVKAFEQINDGQKALETIAETIRKQITPDSSFGLPIVTDGQLADWEGLDLTDAYSRALLGCI